VGTIYGLVDKAILLSHPIFQEKNLEYVVRVLIDNDYPLELIFSRINLRIKTLIKKSHAKKPEPNSHIEDRKMLVLPCISNFGDY